MRERCIYWRVLAGSLSLSLSLSLVLLFHTKPPGSKRQKNVEFSPKHILLFPDVEKVPLSRTPFARDEASGSFVVQRPLVARDEGRDAFLLGGWSFPGVPKATRGI